MGLVDSLPSASVAGAGTVVLVKGTGKFHVSNGSAWTEQKLVATSSADKLTLSTEIAPDSTVAIASSAVYSLQNTLEEQIRQVEESIPDDTVTTAQMDAAAGEAKTTAVSESKTYTDTQLGSYYKKTEIDSEVAALENKISAIPKFTMSVVSSLPPTGDSATLYIVGTAGSDSAKEYIYVNNAWELIGDIRITVANAVAQNDGNPVSSGAVYTALQDYLPLNGKAKDSEKADHATSADTATTATNATNATTAGSATKATQDASDNVITSTYATKNELSGEVSSLNSAINAVSQSVEGKMDDTPVDEAPTSGSANLVTSGGVYDAINTLSEGIPSGGEAGQVWTSDGSGAGSWQTPSGGTTVAMFSRFAKLGTFSSSYLQSTFTVSVLTKYVSSTGSQSIPFLKKWMYKNNGTLIYMSDSPFYSESVVSQYSFTEKSMSVNNGIKISNTTISNTLKSLFTWMPVGTYEVVFALNNINKESFDEYVGLSAITIAAGSTHEIYGMKTTMTVDTNGNITTTLPTSGTTVMQVGATASTCTVVLDLLSINIQ